LTIKGVDGVIMDALNHPNLPVARWLAMCGGPPEVTRFHPLPARGCPLRWLIARVLKRDPEGGLELLTDTEVLDNPETERILCVPDTALARQVAAVLPRDALHRLLRLAASCLRRHLSVGGPDRRPFEQITCLAAGRLGLTRAELNLILLSLD
jgi:hypothetical protein